MPLSLISPLTKFNDIDPVDLNVSFSCCAKLPVCEYNKLCLFILVLIDYWLFPFFASVNNDSMSNLVHQESCWILGNVSLTSAGNMKQFSKGTAQIKTSTNSRWGVSLLHIFKKTLYCKTHFCQLGQYENGSHYGFNLHFTI